MSNINLINQLTLLFISLRPKQWIKNIFVFAALVFAQELTNAPLLLRAIGAFVAFSFTASAIYLINDIVDRKEDLHHPQKKDRPLASGKLSVSVVIVSIIALLGISFCISAAWYNVQFIGVLLVYLLLNLSYSLGLKHVVIVDFIIVASGFVLRAMAGALAIDVSISPWLLAATFFLALFLVLGKRRHEMMTLGDDKGNHRKVLSEYSQTILDAFLSMVTTSAVVMYVLYTLSPLTIEHFGTENLIYTVLFVVYGVFRAFFLIYEKNQGGAPTEMVLTDRPLQINLLLWVISVVGIIYSDQLFRF